MILPINENYFDTLYVHYGNAKESIRWPDSACVATRETNWHNCVGLGFSWRRSSL